MSKVRIYKNPRERRRVRIRSKISGTQKIPRLSVFRSNRYIYAQAVDDQNGNTIAAVSGSLVSTKTKKVTKIEQAFMAGQQLAETLLSKNIRRIVFDRSGYLYRGRVKRLAEGLRAGGLQF